MNKEKKQRQMCLNHRNLGREEMKAKIIESLKDWHHNNFDKLNAWIMGKIIQHVEETK